MMISRQFVVPLVAIALAAPAACGGGDEPTATNEIILGPQAQGQQNVSVGDVGTTTIVTVTSESPESSALIESVTVAGSDVQIVEDNCSGGTTPCDLKINTVAYAADAVDLSIQYRIEGANTNGQLHEVSVGVNVAEPTTTPPTTTPPTTTPPTTTPPTTTPPTTTPPD